MLNIKELWSVRGFAKKNRMEIRVARVNQNSSFVGLIGRAPMRMDN